MSVPDDRGSIRIGAKAFALAGGILLTMMIVSGVLTRVIPPGSYQRMDFEGRSMVVEDSFRFFEAGEAAELRRSLPPWRWITAPIEVIWGDNRLLVIILMIFLVFIGGAFSVVEISGVMEAMLVRAVNRFAKRKYLLLALVMGVIMALASFVGIFEAMTPTVIFLVPLALALGWDSLVGLGMSLLAMGFGFAAAVTNPFTVAVAQKIGELPLYSGSLFRIVFFLVAYAVAFGFVALYARRVERDPSRSLCREADAAVRERYAPERLLEKGNEPPDSRMGRALRWFGLWIGGGVAFLLLSALLPSLSTDYAFPVVALTFLVSGLGAGAYVGMGFRRLMATYGKGVLHILPGILLILMAMSVPHIMTAGGVMDTILFHAAELIRGTGPFVAAFLVYLVTLGMNFFVSSASAKAFLMMPILIPLADIVGLTRQTVVFAFDMGDGFSNIAYPTNALLLIALSFTAVGWGTWIRWTWKVQAIIFVVSMGFLAAAVAGGYGPF